MTREELFLMLVQTGVIVAEVNKRGSFGHATSIMYEAHSAVGRLPKKGHVLDWALEFLNYELGARDNVQPPQWLEGWHPYDDAQEPR